MTLRNANINTKIWRCGQRAASQMIHTGDPLSFNAEQKPKRHASQFDL
jgi:hypothetical protein